MIAELIAGALHSAWLPGVLALAVTVDGALPVLPSEPLLFAAVAAATGDPSRVAVLFGAALLGSLFGDGLLYAMGRGSHAVLRGPPRQQRVVAWVHRHLHRRPILVLVAVRLIPAGRLLSVTAAGRVRLPVRRWVPATVVAGLMWSAYMTGVGLLLGPVTGGDPLLSLLAGLASATVIGGVVAVGQRVAARVGGVRAPVQSRTRTTTC